ncbi:MAG TPA: helix-turn-helix domain-containing protein [Jiangellaceae bacterium]|nr:helix-turn-helix domain-containing protein [Jiangellaceae bacterium]
MNETVNGATGDTSSRVGASRWRILRTLRSTQGGLGVQELADTVGLHANTVRFHLDRLVSEGLVRRDVQERHEPGRPRLAFTAIERPQDDTSQRNYQLLAEVLAGFVSSNVPDPEASSTEAGRAWGRYLAESPRPFSRTEQREAIDELIRILTEVGFEPEIPADDPPRINLHHCPFLEVAAEHRDIVCSVHLGLMQGALAELRAPVTTPWLTPFVGPSLCVAGLEPTTNDDGDDGTAPS